MLKIYYIYIYRERENTVRFCIFLWLSWVSNVCLIFFCFEQAFLAFLWTLLLPLDRIKKPVDESVSHPSLSSPSIPTSISENILKPQRKIVRFWKYSRATPPNLKAFFTLGSSHTCISQTNKSGTGGFLQGETYHHTASPYNNTLLTNIIVFVFCQPSPPLQSLPAIMWKPRWRACRSQWRSNWAPCWGRRRESWSGSS